MVNLNHKSIKKFEKEKIPLSINLENINLDILIGMTISIHLILKNIII